MVHNNAWYEFSIKLCPITFGKLGYKEREAKLELKQTNKQTKRELIDRYYELAD